MATSKTLLYKGVIYKRVDEPLTYADKEIKALEQKKNTLDELCMVMGGGGAIFDAAYYTLETIGKTAPALAEELGHFKANYLEAWNAFCTAVTTERKKLKDEIKNLRGKGRLEK